jgi:hypothetical protein
VAAEPNLDSQYKDDPAYRRFPYRVMQALADAFARESSRPVQVVKRKILPWPCQTGFRSIGWNLTPYFWHRDVSVCHHLRERTADLLGDPKAEGTES